MHKGPDGNTYGCYFDCVEKRTEEEKIADDMSADIYSMNRDIEQNRGLGLEGKKK